MGRRFNWVHVLYQKDEKKDIELKISNEIPVNKIQISSSRCLVCTYVRYLEWRNISIGTFGFDPLKNVQDQQSGMDIESLDDDDEEEEYYSVENDIQECEITEGNEELYPLIYANIGDEVIYNETINESNNNSSETNMKKERITLADLFSADSDHHYKADRPGKNTEPEIFTKKLVHHRN
ncbi:hypothetical protein HAX54_034046 [Datura stramonium]|uniref:Protein TILLER ANGLE CONTROL 1 n=1 Tax=Datura stramonium TaxID=4076 RepID=A0ABS8SE23_DATST|nr:hypothetical protein [Datura stramonium]